MATTAAKPKGQSHDTELLAACNVGSFRQWLITQGYNVTEPDRTNAARGVHYWIDLPGCKPVSVQEGFGRKQRYAQTHFRLRSLLSSYMASPVAAAIKDVVRPQASGQLQVVVKGKIQPSAQAASNDVPAILKAPARAPGRYLLSDADIAQALAIDSPIPAGVDVQHVFGVRVGDDDRKGMTVVAHMKVYESPDARRLVEVVEYPIITAQNDISSQAEALLKRATELPKATILVDVLGDGLKFFQHLQAFACPTVARYGMTMGQALPKGGNGKRFANRRTECSVLAAEAIRNRDMKLVLPSDTGLSDPLVLLGSKIPYELSAENRYLVAKPSQIVNAQLPTADLFDACCMAFLSVAQPLAVEKSVSARSNPPAAPQAPAKKPGQYLTDLRDDLLADETPAPACANPPTAPGKKLDQYLTDLRDDFAVSCPLQQEKGESLAAFANRRWVYAQAMIDARPV